MSRHEATRTPKNKCLACHASIDAYLRRNRDQSGLGQTAAPMFGDDVPKPGDVTICMKCGHVMSFNKDLTVRELTDEEMLDAAGDQRILKIQAVRGALRALRDRRK